nr:immunoglobulin heavy chain junction region [Macaca mulatta]MOW86986.1 immunoglobulin heavy chain junction region [Macaca mulatta]MOW87026.1 immunoglobulin heavy chain junction region [Macaca mulatta]MOW87035.1 immunoglobulin heavy chain junction region [Macaca mulatta]MOW87201.1 immunoglobulin heavy chain junction region [Macaca mulatta]
CANGGTFWSGLDYW